MREHLLVELRGLRHVLVQPANRSSEHMVPMPAALDHAAPELSEPMSHLREGSGLATVLELPGFLGCPPGAGQAHRHFAMVAQVHHALRVADRPAAPALPGRWVGRGSAGNGRIPHGQARGMRADCSLKTLRSSCRAGTFRGPSGVG